MKVWTLGIKCDRCEQTFGVKRVPTHLYYGAVLIALRAEAVQDGWMCFHGAGNRAIDLCPAHRGGAV